MLIFLKWKESFDLHLKNVPKSYIIKVQIKERHQRIWKRGADMNMKKNVRRSDDRDIIRTMIPVVTALFVLMLSAAYIAYRMVSNYNYNERWKDYDECGLG